MKKIISVVAGLLALVSCNSNEPKAETAAKTDGNVIIENIMTRTSIRQFTDQTISGDTIETLLRAGMAAPSAVNKQPWHFVAVTSKDKLKDMAINNPNARMLEQAPLAIVVCGDMQKALEGEARASWTLDCPTTSFPFVPSSSGIRQSRLSLKTSGCQKTFRITSLAVSNNQVSI